MGKEQRSYADEPAVGIDLGTTYSAIAYVDETGRPRTIRRSSGELVTPSAVAVYDGEVVVGQRALRMALVAPDGYADSFKREMGAREFHQEICGIAVPPEVLSAFVLEHLIRDAESQLGRITRAVITVPAFFDESRRRATHRAGKLAGLETVDIINEPTAAALAYSSQEGMMAVGSSLRTTGPPRVAMVYDLGGGTFDVTALRIDGEGCRVLATDGDVKLGGRDFDERLVDYLADQFLAKHGMDLRSSPETCARLWEQAVQIKHSLSERRLVKAAIEHEGLRLDLDIARQGFEQLIADLIGRTELTVSMILKEAGLTWHQLDRLLLVGGSTRIPMVAAMVERISGKKPDRSLSPDEAVAHGAALYAAILQQGTDGAKLLPFTDVCSHSLGVVGRDPTSGRKVVTVVIPKNTPLPCTAEKTFHTAKADQRAVAVPVVEGESYRPQECTLLGQCEVRDLPAGLPAGTRVLVEFSYSSEGLLSVTARVPDVRRSANVQIVRDSAGQLDDLDTWRSRLTGGVGLTRRGGEEESLAELGISTVAEHINRLYREIGRAALEADVPWAIRGAQRRAREEAAKLGEMEAGVQKAEKEHEAAVSHTERVGSLAQLSRWRSRLREQQLATNEALTRLGQRCVEKGWRVDAIDRELRELDKLTAWLRETEERVKPPCLRAQERVIPMSGACPNGDFDPYHQWLGIPPGDRPPDHYELLGISLFEEDPEVIESAAHRQATHVRSYRLGPHSAECERLLGEIAEARACLLDPKRRAEYESKQTAFINRNGGGRVPAARSELETAKLPKLPQPARIPRERPTSKSSFVRPERMVKQLQRLIRRTWVQGITSVVLAVPTFSLLILLLLILLWPRTTIVIWNVHYSDEGPRGAQWCNLYVFGDGQPQPIWGKNGVKLNWDPRKPVKTSVRVREDHFDRLLVEITGIHGSGGGLTEIEVFRGNENIAARTQAINASGERRKSQQDERFVAANAIDGNKSSDSFGVGSWLLPDGQKSGWIELRWSAGD